MKIAIDFDGTVVAHKYPLIGKDIGAVPVLRELLEAGHTLTLCTMRSGKELDQAVMWFHQKGIALRGVNEDPGQGRWTTSPKPYAELYIDDSALGVPLTYPSGAGERPYVDWEKARILLVERGFLPVELKGGVNNGQEK